MKLLSGRASMESSHLAVLSDPSFAALNKYLDSYGGNTEIQYVKLVDNNGI